MAKKRGQGTGSITEITTGRHKGKYQARIDLGRDESGKRKRPSKYFNLKRDAEKWVRENLNDVDNNAYIEPSNITVGQWLTTWCKDYKKRSVRPGSYVKFIIATERHIGLKIGHIKLKDLRPEAVQRMINEWIDEGLGTEAIKKNMEILRLALRQACENELIKKNVAVNAKLPKGKKTNRRVFTPEEQTRFLEAIKGHSRQEIFVLLLATGLRISEALALTWDDIDFDNNTLSVNKGMVYVPEDYSTKRKNQHKKIVGPPKTKSSYRIVPLLPSVVQMLKEYKENQALIEKCQTFRDNNLVFCNNQTGEHLVPNGISQQLKRMLKIAGVSTDGFGLHNLRHTFATRGLEKDVELRVMQELLGHSSIKMTADLYTHVLPDKKTASILKLEDTINI